MLGVGVVLRTRVHRQLKVVPVPPLYVKMCLLFCRQVKVIPEPRHIFAPENILLLCTQKIQLMVLTPARLRH